jgi:hypothetical protein
MTDVTSSLGAVAFYASIAITGALASGLIVLLYALGTEHFAPAIRSTGVGLAATAGRAGAIATAYFGAYVGERSGVTVFFLVTGALLLAACLSFNLAGPRRSAAAAVLAPGPD